MTNQNEYPLNEAGKDTKTFLVIKEKDNTEAQNDLAIFICLPQNLCAYKIEEFEADLVNQTKAALERYYEPFNVEILYTTNVIWSIEFIAYSSIPTIYSIIVIHRQKSEQPQL